MLDGSRPLEGIALNLHGASPYHAGFAVITTGADGLAVHEGLSEGDYRVTVTQAGCWPSEHLARATRSGPPTTIRVRRVGSLAIELRRGGFPLPGTRIELVDEELGQRVADWLARGEARAFPSDLRTDARGLLRVDGIPRGRYRWSVDLGPAGVHAGLLEVPPAAVGEARIALP